MRFRKDNKIRYRQDFRSHVGIPSGVDLTIENDSGMFKQADCFVLKGDGYGDRETTYGNGAIYVSKESLSFKQLQRYERVLEEQSCHHEWGTDGQHSNEFCKKCFISKPLDEEQS